MPDYKEYRKSISRELISIKDRIRNFGILHWGEDGRYKEVILSNILRNYLPKNISVGTGFVIGENDQLSSQIDIIVYRNDYPSLFSYGDFVILAKQSVLGIIEVKSRLTCREFSDSLLKSHTNGQIIGNQIFNGIFGFETAMLTGNNMPQSVKDALNENHGFVNNICFGKDLFMKYWLHGNPQENNGVECCSFYRLEDLSFGYFVSNLIEDIYIITNSNQCNCLNNDPFRRFLYPIERSKEACRIAEWELLFEEVQ